MGGRGRIRNPRDFFGGLALIGVAVFALWASSDLPGMHGFAFGPGTAPRMFAVLLGILGAGIALVGFFTDGPNIERFAIRGPVLVTASILVFAGLLRPAGLVLAGFISMVVAASATNEVRWVETLIWSAVMTLFCVILFPYLLGLPMQLWPAGF
jgi:putative tricarboxylic transport membrane protein